MSELNTKEISLKSCSGLTLELNPGISEEWRKGASGRISLIQSLNVAERGDGKSATEISAAIPLGNNRYFFATDKPIPGKSEQTGILDPSLPEQPITTVSTPILDTSTKFEASAKVNLGGKDFILLSTAFGWHASKETPSFDSFNRLVALPADNLKDAKIISAAKNPDLGANAVEGSLEIHKQLKIALGSEYLKVEGLAAVKTGDREANLFFGLRETGTSFKDPKQCFTIVSARLKLNSDNQFEISDFKKEYEQAINEITSKNFRKSGIDKDLGISSLEYDPTNKRFIALTSVEIENKQPGKENEFIHGTFIWTISEVDGKPSGDLKRVTDSNNQHIFLPVKAEALAEVSGSNGMKWMILADPDRKEWGASENILPRHNGQSPLYVVEIQTD